MYQYQLPFDQNKVPAHSDLEDVVRAVLTLLSRPDVREGDTIAQMTGLPLCDDTHSPVAIAVGLYLDVLALAFMTYAAKRGTVLHVRDNDDLWMHPDLYPETNTYAASTSSSTLPEVSIEIKLVNDAHQCDSCGESAHAASIIEVRVIPHNH